MLIQFNNVLAHSIGKLLKERCMRATSAGGRGRRVQARRGAAKCFAFSRATTKDLISPQGLGG